MAEYLINGGIVFIAVVVAGAFFFLLRALFLSKKPDPAREEVSKLTKELHALKEDQVRNKEQIATLNAELKNASLKINEQTDALETQAEKFNEVINERNRLKEQAARDTESAKSLEQRITDLREAKDQMRQEFNEIAGQLMKSHGETFKEQNKDQISNLLKPFREQIDKFEKEVNDSNRDSRDQHVALAKHIETLTQQSALASQETKNLTRALKGNVQMQGAWGEMVLETILQRSGLREGEEYTSQQSHTTEDGSRLRTDYIVHLPNGEKIVIDAKVSLKSFEEFVNAEEDTMRAARLASHVSSVKGHIKNLAAKEYHSTAGSELDFVIMFMPIEAALGAALQQDGEIGFFAADNKVAIATPTTLTIALKTIASIWRVERQNRNAAEIAKRAGKLYDKFVGFLGDMSEIGDRLRQADDAYSNAMNKLSKGRGNLVGQIEQLKSMGAKTNKSIASEILDDAQLPVADDAAKVIEYGTEQPPKIAATGK